MSRLAQANETLCLGRHRVTSLKFKDGVLISTSHEDRMIFQKADGSYWLRSAGNYTQIARQPDGNYVRLIIKGEPPKENTPCPSSE